MDLYDKLQLIAGRIPQITGHIRTEEATKMALIVPFLSALGWDVYNPEEVVPEYTADVLDKKGEKVDYAIQKDGRPIILIEAKKVGKDDGKNTHDQLYRYFTATEARVGVITDGVHYRFYADLEQPNVMDRRPFFEFDLSSFDENTAREVKRFSKTAFDEQEMISAAVELKYTKAIKGILSDELRDPSPEMVNLLAKRVYSGRITQGVREKFHDIARRAFSGWVTDAVARRLQTALESADGDTQDEQPPAGAADRPEQPNKKGVVTTEDEIEGYMVVKAIVASEVKPSRVVLRDGKAYCAIILDDNNRKPLCRLWFNGKQKYLGLLNEDKMEEKVAIDAIDGIYDFSEKIRNAARRYA